MNKYLTIIGRMLILIDIIFFIMFLLNINERVTFGWISLAMFLLATIIGFYSLYLTHKEKEIKYLCSSNKNSLFVLYELYRKKKLLIFLNSKGRNFVSAKGSFNLCNELPLITVFEYIDNIIFEVSFHQEYFEYASYKNKINKNSLGNASFEKVDFTNIEFLPEILSELNPASITYVEERYSRHGIKNITKSVRKKYLLTDAILFCTYLFLLLGRFLFFRNLGNIEFPLIFFVLAIIIGQFSFYSDREKTLVAGTMFFVMALIVVLFI